MSKPEIGEWWMCKSTESLRQCPMIKVANGWGGIANTEGKPLGDFIQTRPILTPLFKMVRLYD